MRISITEALKHIYNTINERKQDKLAAGTGIHIVDNVISSEGTTYTAGNNIEIQNNEISANYSPATVQEDGLMSAVDKIKLNATVSSSALEYQQVNSDQLYINARIPFVDKTSVSGNSFVIDPNKLYDFGERIELNISFNPGPSEIINEYMFYFTSGDTATTLNVPANVIWTKDPDIQTDSKYLVSIESNLGIIGEWSNE